jgi:hypothetical protein
MRKQFKNKLRSCGLCKPHKRGWSSRWKPQQRQALLEADRQLRSVRMKALAFSSRAEQAAQPELA